MLWSQRWKTILEAPKRPKILFPNERIPCQRGSYNRGKWQKWYVDHFEALSTPTVSLNFDNEFANSIWTHVQNIVQNCINDPTGALNEPLTYDEVATVCSNLKPGVSGVSLAYKQIGMLAPCSGACYCTCTNSFLKTFQFVNFWKRE